MELLRPLLAAKTTDADLQRLKWPMLASPKIDGIRALVRNGQLRSRTMKLIPNKYTQALFGRPELEGLDGELVVGNAWDSGLMQATSSGVMSHGGTPDISYHVFDKWNDPRGFTHRHCVELATLVEELQPVRVELVPHCVIHDYEHFLEKEEIFLARGYEGIMLRSLHGKYKQNRSTLREGILLKVKRFEDGEAIVIGYEPLYRNNNEAQEDERGYTKRTTHQANKVADELLGTLRVRSLETGKEFSVGSGFTEAQRRTLWIEREQLRGRTVSFKHFAVTGVKDKPRIPIFRGFRDPRDM